MCSADTVGQSKLESNELMSYATLPIQMTKDFHLNKKNVKMTNKKNVKMMTHGWNLVIEVLDLMI